MDFGSEYVYRYSDSEEEEISADAIESGVDSVPGAVVSAPARGGRHVHVHDVGPHRPPRQHSSRNATGQKWRRADTNVVVVKFDCLTEPSNMHTGDPIVCSGCQVMLSHISKISEHEAKKIWTCEFCETKNEVDIVSEEIPSKADVTYMLEPAAMVAAASDKAGASGKIELPESIVVFCIDYSGSMATVVAGTGNTRITRLDGVKRAVCHQLERLADSDPGCRVAVVAFESSAKVIADGKDIREHRVDNSIFYDKTKLLEVATHLSLPSRISDSQKTLTQNVLKEPTQGGTALGPGLLISVGIARQMARSKVIICTDGEANEGLGSLVSHRNQMGQQDDAYAFYTDVANIAKESGVSVSVLTIAGTHCKLVELGHVAELTGGQVNIVDPQTATEEFGNILENAIIATHATARFFLHRDLYVRGEPDRPSHALRDIGNVTGGAEISFEYGVRRKKKPDGCKGAKKDDGGDGKRDEPDDQSVAVAATVPTTVPVVHAPSTSVPKDEKSIRLPFQVQIRYTDSKGAKAVRVFTETKAVTKDRKVAESKMNLPILGTHAIRDAAEKAIQGEYMNSRLTDCAYSDMFQRNAIHSEPLSKAYGMYERSSKQVQSSVQQAQRAEARSRNSTVMDAEIMMQNMGSDEVRKKRRQMFTDEFAEGCYQNMKVSSSTFDATDAKPKSSGSKHTSAP